MSKHQFLDAVEREIDRAREKHAPINSLHEGYAVILEELDEFKAWVWRRAEGRDRLSVEAELVQIAAMCCRVAEDVLKMS